MEADHTKSMSHVGTVVVGEDSDDRTSKQSESQREKRAEGESVSFREQWKSPAFRGKIAYSMYLSAASLALGMYVGQHGPTFQDIQIITNSDIKAAAAFFTSSSAGYLLGCILTGIIYNKSNKSLLMFLSTLGLGITNIFVPYCAKYELMMMIRFVTGAFAGCVDTGQNSEHMRIWGSEANGLLQFLHFCFSVGGFLSPLIAEPFLTEKLEDSDDMNGTNRNRSTLSSLNSTDGNNLRSTETRVEYLFLIVGVCIVLVSFLFLIEFFKNRRQSRSGEPEQKVEKRRFSRKGVPFPLLIVLLCGICLFYFTYCCVEDSFFAFLMTFLVEEYDTVSKSQGAVATAVAWAAFAVARFLMIFLTKVLTTMQLLFLMSISMAVAFTAFTIFAYYQVVDALVVCAAIAALSLSGIFPSGFSWMETEMFQVTGIVSSCILVSSTLGTIVNPLIIGSLMKDFSNMWFCYLLVIDTYVLVLLLITLLVFSRCFIDRKYGDLPSSLETADSDSTVAAEDLQLKCDEDLNNTDEDMGGDGVHVSFIQ